MQVVMDAVSEHLELLHAFSAARDRLFWCILCRFMKVAVGETKDDCQPRCCIALFDV